MPVQSTKDARQDLPVIQAPAALMTGTARHGRQQRLDPRLQLIRHDPRWLLALPRATISLKAITPVPGLFSGRARVRPASRHLQQVAGRAPADDRTDDRAAALVPPPAHPLGDPPRHPRGLHDPRRRHHLLATSPADHFVGLLIGSHSLTS
jgi:hypothetical protein